MASVGIISMQGKLFDRYIGIDYSGSGLPTDGRPGIQVFTATPDADARPVRPPVDRLWSRAVLAAWLIEQMAQDQRLIVGIDHAFALPHEKMGDCANWVKFLEKFREVWGTDERQVTLAAIASRYHDCRDLLRLTEQWTSSAKSVFNCQGPGVACSTFAGIPWLLRIRQACGDRVFFWPFDGWVPDPTKHVIAEVYPALFKNRYRTTGLTGDALDAFSVSQWLKEMDKNGFLEHYFAPPLTTEQRILAQWEGWILGVC
jgi:hypothetical protein